MCSFKLYLTLLSLLLVIACNGSGNNSSTDSSSPNSSSSQKSPVEAIISAVANLFGFDSAPTFGTGADGKLELPGTEGEVVETVVNKVSTFLTKTATDGSTTLSVNTIDGFNPKGGDLLLLLETQNSQAEKGTLSWEFATTQSALSVLDTTSHAQQPTITLTKALAKTYHASSSAADPYATSQVILVPQYTDVTLKGNAQLTASAWDSTNKVGGVLVFKASGTVTLKDTAQIQVNSKGFVGGQACEGVKNGEYGTCCFKPDDAQVPWCIAQQGESWLGPGATAEEAREQDKSIDIANGGGGGAGATRDTYMSDGGLAGHKDTAPQRRNWANNDTNDSSNWMDTDAAGESYGTEEIIGMGSGGGGAAHISGDACAPQAGGAGGGIILIYAKEIVIQGTSAVIQAHGGEGLEDKKECANDVSGAGSGGFISLKTAQSISTASQNQITASGGSSPNYTTLANSAKHSDNERIEGDSVHASDGYVKLNP